MYLTGKRALVTSGSGALGASIARELAAQGASVAVNYFSSGEAAEELVADLHRTTPGDHVAVHGDTTTSDGVRALVGSALEHLGNVDVLVNNSGPYSKTPFEKLPEEEFDRIWNANVKATYLATQLVVPGMRRAGWGRIINLSAVSAHVRNRSIYGLSKAAIEVLTEELAVELGPEITVNAVGPGQIKESLEDMMGLDPTWADAVTARTPLGRLTTRREVAELAVLLCSPVFDMVTGVTIPIDGGLRLPRF